MRRGRAIVSAATSGRDPWRLGVVVFMAAMVLLAGPVAATPPDDDDDDIGASLETPVAPTLEELIARCGSRRLGEREASFLELLYRVTEDDVPLLVRALREEPRTRARTRVARLLGHLGAEAAEAPLLEILQNDRSPHARGAAAYALADLRCREAVDVLIKTLNEDPDDGVRKRAATALGDIGGAAARMGIESAALNPRQRWDVRRAAQWLVDHPHRGGVTIARTMPGQVTKGTHHGTDYQLYVPRSFNRAKAYDLLVVVHGTGGLPDASMQMCIADAERYGVIVLAPHFDWPTFPDFGRLNAFWGEVRADLRLLEIIDEDVGARINLYDGLLLYGHSQGGSFVHRFAIVHPERVERAAISSANTFVQIDDTEVFPEGLGANPMTPDIGELSLDACLDRPMSFVVGQDEETRFIDPARMFVERACQLAVDQDMGCRIDFRIVPGSGHSGREHYQVARGFLFVGLGE